MVAESLRCVVPNCGRAILGPHFAGMARLCSKHQSADGPTGSSAKEREANAIAAAEWAAGDWFMTSSGRRAHVLAPEDTEIEIEDIAHALSMLCRFGGHCRQFYSVAQHSVLVSECVPARMALQALLHDAPEAYLGDVIRPLKRELARYTEIEETWWSAIAHRFDVPEEQPPEIKRADLIALVTERRDLLLPHTWQPKEDRYGPILPDERPIVPLEPAAARDLFLSRFRALGGP